MGMVSKSFMNARLALKRLNVKNHTGMTPPPVVGRKTGRRIIKTHFVHKFEPAKVTRSSLAWLSCDDGEAPIAVGWNTFRWQACYGVHNPKRSIRKMPKMIHLPV